MPAGHLSNERNQKRKTPRIRDLNYPRHEKGRLFPSLGRYVR